MVRSRGSSSQKSLLILVLCVLIPLPVLCQTTEYELKAAFLYNFTQFVTWPAESFDASDTFKMCVAGPDPFGKILDEITKEEKVQEHKIEVARYEDVRQADGCHLIFLSGSNSADVERALKVFNGKPVLLIGEAPEFAEKGGTIAFRVVERRVKLRINLKAARQANLTISSKLLRVSEVIGE